MKDSDLDRRLIEDLGFGRVLVSIARSRYYYIGKKLEKFDISKSEYKILIEVYIAEGCCQEDIVHNLGIDKFEVAKGIKSLISKEYICKQKDLQDKRKCRLYPSEKAMEIKKSFIQILLDSTEVLTEGLTEEEKKVCLEIMIKMAKNMYQGATKIKFDNSNGAL